MTKFGFAKSHDNYSHNIHLPQVFIFDIQLSLWLKRFSHRFLFVAKNDIPQLFAVTKSDLILNHFYAYILNLIFNNFEIFIIWK